MGLTAILGVMLYAAGRVEEPVEFLVSCSVMGLMSVLVNAIMLPFLYKFGPERARMMFFGIMGGIVLLVVAALFPLGGLEWLKSLDIAEPSLAQLSVLPAIAAVAGVALLALSFLLSRYFYGQKDI